MKQGGSQIIFALFVAILLGYFCCKKVDSCEGYAQTTLKATPTMDDKNGPLNWMSRPNYQGNMAPYGMNNVVDPFVNSNNLRGMAPPVVALGTDNQIISTPLSNAPPASGDQTQMPVEQGRYVAGMNDAASYAGTYQYNQTYGQTPLDQLSFAASAGGGNGSDFTKIGSEFAYLATDNNSSSKSFTATETENKKSDKPNTLEYPEMTTLLPTPDLRTPLMRDPSDPENFMYTRTLTATLKTRNINTVDRFRGDLDIAPIKTGWFDIATTPSIDLAKGYFGTFNDISQYTILQDAVYERDRDRKTNPEGALRTEAAINNLAGKIAMEEMTKPNLAYGNATSLYPTLKFGSVGDVFGNSRVYDP
jgi:hypothetical protein